MDSSDTIKKLRDKVVFYSLLSQVSTAQVFASGTSYTFPDYKTKNEYNYGQFLSTTSTIVVIGY